MVEVKVIPSVYEFITLRAEAEMFEGLPVITLQGSPLYGWNLVLKRGVDLIGATVALVLTSPVLLLIAALVKLTSPGPIFYWQNRMGLDGRAFAMLKFRTMQVDAEAETGPVWAQANDTRRTLIGSFLRRTSLEFAGYHSPAPRPALNDTRRTLIGSFLRRTSLDELPQFWNVLK